MTAPTSFERGDHVELGRGLRDAISADPGRDLVYDEGVLYRYIAPCGLWGPVDDDDSSRLIQKFAGLPSKTPYGKETKLRIQANDIRGAIAMAKDQSRKVRFFAEAPMGLSFTNGFLEIKDDGSFTFGKLRRENRARHGFAYAYDATAKSKPFEDFLDSVFRDDADKAEKIAFVQELFGASLTRAVTRYQKCGLFIGDGENGKDTLIDVLASVFPEKTTVAVAPQRWVHEYSRAKLAGAWLNVVGELPRTELDASEAFKAMVTGSELDGRHPHGKVFNFRPIAGHVFAANSHMGTPDFSHGFFRRFGVVRFNRRFTAEERDPEIKERLIATERPAIITWLLEGARRLIARGKYVLPSSHFAELETWKLSSDQVAMFLDQNVRPLKPGETGIFGGALYQSYVAWAEENGHKRMSSTTFGTRAKIVLAEHGYPETPRRNLGVLYQVALRKTSSPGGLVMAKVQGPKSTLHAGQGSNIIVLNNK